MTFLYLYLRKEKEEDQDNVMVSMIHPLINPVLMIVNNMDQWMNFHEQFLSIYFLNVMNLKLK